MKYNIVYIDYRTYEHILIDENKCLWKASLERIKDNMIDGEVSDCIYKVITNDKEAWERSILDRINKRKYYE